MFDDWKWVDAHRHLDKPDGNWEVSASSPDGDSAMDLSLDNDGGLSLHFYLPAGSGINGALYLMGEALSRLNRAQFPGSTTASLGGMPAAPAAQGDG